MMFFLVSACRLNGSLLTMQLPETLGGLVVETGPGFFPALKLKISICVKIRVVNQVPTCIVLYTFDHAIPCWARCFPCKRWKKDVCDPDTIFKIILLFEMSSFIWIYYSEVF